MLPLSRHTMKIFHILSCIENNILFEGLTINWTMNLVSYIIAIKICVQVFYIFSLSWIHWKSIIRPKLLQWSLVLAPIYHQPNRHNASKMYAKLVMHTKQIRDIPLYLKPSKLQCSKVTISQKLYLLMHMFLNIILCQTPISRFFTILMLLFQYQNIN